MIYMPYVHQGDVGGGHYHAHIRPNSGVGFDYQTFAAQAEETARNSHMDSEGVPLDSNGGFRILNSNNRRNNGCGEFRVRTAGEKKDILENQARHGQWYKFDDETVQMVRPFEAINQCFGRNKTTARTGSQMGTLPVVPHLSPSLPLIPPLGSAYMLVYIRESNAAETMAKVTQGDIPPCLTNKLDAIMVQRIREERKLIQAKTFKTVKYATEEHVRDFHGYRLEGDLWCLS
jgi:hypothetical protein